MKSGVNTVVSTILGSDGKPIKKEIENKQTEKQTVSSTQKKADSTGEEDKDKHKHKKYIPSIDLTALKELEGTTASSFKDLVKAVIKIDKKKYDEKQLPLSKERKSDLMRLIEHYAVIEVIGKRKYHIKRVYSKQQREELNELETFSKRDTKKQ